MTEQDELRETLLLFGKRSADIFVFTEELMGVRINPGQTRWFKLVGKVTDKAKFWYRRVIHRAANQTGKTLGLALADLWAAHNKIGIEHADAEFLMGAPYKVLHLGPGFQTSRKMLNDDMIPLLEGRHPAQYDKKTGKFRPCKFPRGAWQKVNFEGEYPGIRLWNGSEIYFRTLDDRAKGISQLVANVISVDEAGLEDYLKETEDITLKMRVVANEGPIWYVGTPDGPNDFAEMIWDMEAKGTEVENRIWTDEERKTALAWSIFDDNVGYGVTQEEANYQEATQDPATKEAKLRGAILFPSKAFFTPSQNIIRAWVPGLQSRETPLPGHNYVIFWDVSVESDPTVMVVLDVTRKPWRGVKFRRWVKPMAVQDLIDTMEQEHRYWSEHRAGEVTPTVKTGYDSTAMGGAMFGQLLKNIKPKFGMNLGGSAKIKTQALADMRAMMSRLEVLWPEEWLTLRKEIMGYRLDDKHLRQDSVMAAAGAIWLARMTSGSPRVKSFDIGYQQGLEALVGNS